MVRNCDGVTHHGLWGTLTEKVDFAAGCWAERMAGLAIAFEDAQSLYWDSRAKTGRLRIKIRKHVGVIDRSHERYSAFGVFHFYPHGRSVIPQIRT
jgi:hypothetical protein